MRFQKSEPTPPFGPRDRRIVFLFLGALGIFFVIQVASKPEFWKAMRGSKATETAQAPAAPAPDDGSQLRDDENIFASDSGGDSQTPFNAAVDYAPISTKPDSEVRVPPDVLQSVRDNMLGIRAAERQAYYATLDYAKRLTPDALAAEAERVPYTMLMAEPASFRGRPVAIAGRLRRLVPLPSSDNAFGIEQLYEAWVFSSDSGSNPIRVVCSSIPDGIRPAEIYTENPPEVTLSGFFFKTQGYESRGDGTRAATLHTAPLVLASSFEHVPVVEAQTRDIASEMVPWLWWFAIGIGSLLALVLWNFAASDWTFRHTRAHGILQPDRSVDFEGVDAVTTSEMLQTLSTDGSSQL